jgi:hypothetical protein
MAVAYLATRLVQKYALTPAVTEVVDELNIYLVGVCCFRVAVAAEVAVATATATPGLKVRGLTLGGGTRSRC